MADGFWSSIGANLYQMECAMNSTEPKNPWKTHCYQLVVFTLTSNDTHYVSVRWKGCSILSEVDTLTASTGDCLLGTWSNVPSAGLFPL